MAYQLIDSNNIYLTNEVNSLFENVGNVIGNIEELNTDDKTCLVNAINELAGSGIDLYAREKIAEETLRAEGVEQELSNSINTISVEKANAADVYDKANTYDKTEIGTLLQAKANTTDVYTIAEVNSLLEAKVNVSDSYNIAEVDNLLNGKINLSDAYNKAETDNLLNVKVNISDVYNVAETDNLLNAKVNIDDVYNKTEISTLLQAKANTTDVYTTDEVNSLLNAKVNTTDVYNKTEVDNMLNNVNVNLDDYYNKTEVGTLLQSKANTTDVYTTAEVNSLLNGKANVADVYNKAEINNLLANISVGTNIYINTDNTVTPEGDTRIIVLDNCNITLADANISGAKIDIIALCNSCNIIYNNINGTVCTDVMLNGTLKMLYTCENNGYALGIYDALWN